MNSHASKNLNEGAAGITAEQADAVITAENAGVADNVSASVLTEGGHPLVALRRARIAADIQATLQRILNTGADVDNEQDKAA